MISCVIDAVPISVIIARSRNAVDYISEFQLLKTGFEKSSLYSQSYPYVMIDDDAAEKNNFLSKIDFNTALVWLSTYGNSCNLI